MDVKVEKLEKNVVQLEIEVDSDSFEEGMKKSFSKNARMFNIPGFRKGKAPRSIVERYYGEQALYEDAVNFVFPDIYQKAIKDNALNPVDKPEIDIKQVGSGQNLILTAKVTLKPEVELGGYKGISVEKVYAAVSDADVEDELGRIIENNARIISVENRGVLHNDIAVIDFDGTIAGEPFEGGSSTDYSLTIGSGSFIPGFEDQIKDMKIDDEKDLTVTFPEDYHQKECAGKEAIFHVKLKEIKVKELPSADDEFAKDVSEFNNIEEYKADLRKKLQESSEHEAGHRLEDDLLDAVLERCSIDIPQVMIEKQIDGYINDFEMRLGMQYGGMKLEQFLAYTKHDMKSFREQYAERAANSVKTQLVIEKIGEIENIQADPEETDAEIIKIAEGYKQELDEFKKHLSDEDIEYIKKTIISRKTLEFLIANSEITEKEVSAEELSSILMERNKTKDGLHDSGNGN